MAKNTVIITGDKHLNRILRALEAKIAKKSVRTASRAAMKPLAAHTKRAAPVSPAGNKQHKRGNLRRSIKVKALPRSRQWVGTRVTSGTSKSQYRGEAFYGGFVEYGRLTGKRGSANRQPVPGQFFMRKTAERYRHATVRMYQQHLARDVHQAARKRGP